MDSNENIKVNEKTVIIPEQRYQELLFAEEQLERFQRRVDDLEHRLHIQQQMYCNDRFD